MSAASQDKTERATPKREREARKRGQVARSRELSTALVVGASVLALIGAGRALAADALRLMRGALAFDSALLHDPVATAAQLGLRLAEGLWAVMPILGAGLVAAIAAPALLGGWNFSLQAFQPDPKRLDPIAGLGRMLSAPALAELGKSLLKFGLIGAVGAAVIWNRRGELLALSALDPRTAIASAVSLALWMLAWTTGALAIIGLVDGPYQKWRHNRQLRMTKQEVREEMKESDGRPEVKSRIRQLQHQMARGRMMEKVAAADVVLTNPTHYAVALEYRAGKMRAPVVVAKGAGVVAVAIRELAQQHRVPLVSAPPLARALYRGTELEQEIPATLYQAVAQVLTYIYQLRAWRGGTPRPRPPEIGDVPGGEPDA